MDEKYFPRGAPFPVSRTAGAALNSPHSGSSPSGSQRPELDDEDGVVPADDHGALTVRLVAATLPAPSSFLSHHAVGLRWTVTGDGGGGEGSKKSRKREGDLPPVPLGRVVDHQKTPPVVRCALSAGPSAFAIPIEGLSHRAAIRVEVTVRLLRFPTARVEGKPEKVTTVAKKLVLPLLRTGPGVQSVADPAAHVALEFEVLSDADVAAASLASQHRGGNAPSTAAMPLVDAGSSGGDGGVFATAEAVFAPHLSLLSSLDAKTLTPLDEVVADGVVRAAVVRGPVDRIAAELFVGHTNNNNSCGGPLCFLRAFHEVRGDEAAVVPSWRWSSDRRVGLRESSVEARLKRSSSRTAKAIVCSMVCCVDGAYVARVVAASPEVPVVGSAMKLEMVVHAAAADDGPSIAADGGDSGDEGDAATVVTVYCHVRVSPTAMRLFGQKVQRALEKVATGAMDALRLVAGARLVDTVTGDGESASLSGQRRRFRSSVRASQASRLSTSLDPCLWRRLLHPDVLPNAELVTLYLARLLTLRVARVSEAHVAALESAIVYHRAAPTIVASACNVLLQLCRASSYDVVVGLSPTIAATLAAVIALHVPPTYDEGGHSNPAGDAARSAATTSPTQAKAILGRYAELLTSLGAAERAARRTREQQIRAADSTAAAENPWRFVDQCVGDRETLGIALDALATRHRAAHLTTQQIAALCRALALHMQDPSIARSIFRIVARSAGSVAFFPPDLVEALIIAGEQVHPDLAEAFATLLAQLHRRQGAFSAFDRQFASLLHERPVLEGRCMITGPRLVGRRPLYLTPSYLVLGPYVVHLSAMAYVRPYTSRFFWRPGLQIVLAGTHDDYHVLLGDREALIAALKERKVRVVAA